ncbi:MAG: zinc ribbon domain-containing protein [Acidobacteria bacterium]|nr:zinc ribbon domain-containing protein [Acidobacteriota bacterium]
MNSGISTDEPRHVSDEGFRPWHFFVLVSILLATATVVLARRSAPENLILLSFTVGAAGAAAAALYRMLLPFAADDVALAEEPLTERRRATLDKDRMLTLRAIKELEFDRAMGKLSQKDFAEMDGRLRQRALSLMKQLDEGAGYREVIEHELQRRLQRAPERASCGCGAANDDDAIFCKKCGTRLRA